MLQYNKEINATLGCISIPGKLNNIYTKKEGQVMQLAQVRGSVKLLKHN